jgi:hypothetical protein
MYVSKTTAKKQKQRSRTAELQQQKRLSVTVAVPADRLVQMSARGRERRASETIAEKRDQRSQAAARERNRRASENATEAADKQTQDSTLHQQRRARNAVIHELLVIGIRDFRYHIAKLQFPIPPCTRCNESFLDMKFNAQTSICESCKHEKHPNSQLFSKENLMDPSDVPPELSDLTQIEQMVIAWGYKFGHQKVIKKLHSLDFRL